MGQAARWGSVNELREVGGLVAREVNVSARKDENVGADGDSERSFPTVERLNGELNCSLT